MPVVASDAAGTRIWFINLNGSRVLRQAREGAGAKKSSALSLKNHQSGVVRRKKTYPHTSGVRYGCPEVKQDAKSQELHLRLFIFGLAH